MGGCYFIYVLRHSFFRINDIRPYDLSEAADHMPTEAAEVNAQSEFLNAQSEFLNESAGSAAIP